MHGLELLEKRMRGKHLDHTFVAARNVKDAQNRKASAKRIGVLQIRGTSLVSRLTSHRSSQIIFIQHESCSFFETLLHTGTPPGSTAIEQSGNKNKCASSQPIRETTDYDKSSGAT